MQFVAILAGLVVVVCLWFFLLKWVEGATRPQPFWVFMAFLVVVAWGYMKINTYEMAAASGYTGVLVLNRWTGQVYQCTRSGDRRRCEELFAPNREAEAK